MRVLKPGRARQRCDRRSQMFLKRAAATAVLALSVSAPAATTTSWNVNTSGTFTTTGNWSSGVPGSADTAVFRRGTGISYTVTFPGSTPPAAAISYTNDRLRVGNNHVTLARSAVGATYTLGRTVTTEATR